MAGANIGGGFVNTTTADCLDSSSNAYSASVNPGASEACDGYDTDCAGGVNGTDEKDDDADTYLACSNVAGANVGGGFNASSTADCLDSSSNAYSASVNPGASEACDGYDTDCSGGVNGIDETDADGDGYYICTNVAGVDIGSSMNGEIGRAHV